MRKLKIAKTEKVILESQKKYQDFIDFLPQSVFEADVKGNLIFTNQQAFKLFGYTWEELKKIKSVVNLIIPEQREIAKNNIKAIIEGRQKKVEAHEYLFVKKNGKIFPGAVYTDKVVENGKVVGIKGILIDSTEQKKEKEMLKNEKTRLNLFLNSAPFGIVITNKDHQLLYANPQFNEMLGYSTEEVSSREDWFRKIYPRKKYRDIILKLWDESISNNKVLHKTTPRILTVRCKNGKKKYVRFIHVRLATQEVLITLEDVTERKIAEKRLIESYKHLGMINRQVSILSKLKKEESDETLEEKIEEILISANELFQAKASLLYKCDCNIKDCTLISKTGLTRNQITSIRNFNFCTSRIGKESKKEPKQIYGSMEEYGLNKIAGLSEMKYFLFLPIMKENQIIAFTMTFFKKNVEIVNQELFVEIFSLKANSILKGLGVI